MRIALTPSELVTAAQVGARRHAANLLANRPDAHRAPADWSLHIEGSCAELAAARATGRYWLGSVDFRERQAGDLAGGIEVRATDRADGCLILHERDADDRPFVLVTGRAPVFDVRGWIRAADGKRPEWWREGIRSPAFMVPQSALRPLDTLPAPGRAL